MKNREQLPLNLDRGYCPAPGSTGPARSDQRALNESSSDDHDLMELVVSNFNLDLAWRRVKRNRGAPGPDGMTIADCELWLEVHLNEVRQQLLEGTYRPQPVRRKVLKKEGGGERLLGIPNVLDRFIQQAILQILTPWFDPEFSDSSYGFRPNRSAHGAAKQVQRTIRQGNGHIVNIDLSKFFDRVQHDVLMSRVARKVRDKRLLRLIGHFLRAGVMVEGAVQPTEQGTPQGGPLSPFLSNILLDDLDKELEHRGLEFVRYADDFVIFVKSSLSAQRVFVSVQRYLNDTLKLVINQQKSYVGLAGNCEYLGFIFVGRYVTIKVAAKKLTAFKRRIKELTGRSRGISMKRRLSDLRRYMRGWMGYFGLAKQKGVFRDFDMWIRRRIRMCYWKQWRYPRTKVRMLRKLGVSLDMAIKHAVSRKGYWRMSKTPALRIAMPNKWLQEQGMLSLTDLWFQRAPLRGTA